MTGSMKERGISLKTQKGMSLNIDDRKFIKVQNDHIIEVVNEKMAENIKYLAEILISNNNKMFDFMDEIRGELRKINKRIDNHEARILKLENYIELKTG